MNRRRLTFRRERDTVLVLSQDTGGALEYLRQTFDKRELGDGLVASVHGCGSASKTMLADARRALAGRSRGYPHSKYVMLVVDRDRDPGLSGVLNATRSMLQIETFVSVPCIEYYFMLHFGADRPAMNTFADLEPHLKTKPGFSKYSKTKSAVPIVQLTDLALEARNNAAICRAACVADGSISPRSDLDLLFEAMDAASLGGLQELARTRNGRDERRIVL